MVQRPAGVASRSRPAQREWSDSNCSFCGNEGASVVWRLLRPGLPSVGSARSSAVSMPDLTLPAEGVRLIVVPSAAEAAVSRGEPGRAGERGEEEGGGQTGRRRRQVEGPVCSLTSLNSEIQLLHLICGVNTASASPPPRRQRRQS